MTEETLDGPGLSGQRSVPEVEGFSELAPIGHGGFSSVFRARDDVLGRAVALKVLATNQIDDRRFRRECRILASLADTGGIVSVLQATTTADGRPVIVMRLYEGGSLSDRVKAEGPADVGTVIRMGCVLASALGTAHRAGVYHRDVKPDNVLFTRSGDPAIGDFGIAVSPEIGGSSETLGSLSPPHAPPERFSDDRSFDPTAGDIYSLGSTLHYALTGRAPFGTASDEGGLAALMERVCEDPFPPIERDDVGDDLNGALAMAMAKDPRDRFDSMEGLLAVLRGIHPTAMASWTAPYTDVIHVGSVPWSAPEVGVEASALGESPVADADTPFGALEPPPDGSGGPESGPVRTDGEDPSTASTAGGRPDRQRRILRLPLAAVAIAVTMLAALVVVLVTLVG